MKKIIIFWVLISTLIFGQNAVVIDKWDALPEYYKAIEAAADGNFKDSRAVFAKIYNLFKIKLDALINLQICDDVISGNLSKEAGEYLFKSQFYED